MVACWWCCFELVSGGWWDAVIWWGCFTVVLVVLQISTDPVVCGFGVGFWLF